MLLGKGDVKRTHESEYNCLEKLVLPSGTGSLKICLAAWDVEHAVWSFRKVCDGLCRTCLRLSCPQCQR